MYTVFHIIKSKNKRNKMNCMPKVSLLTTTRNMKYIVYCLSISIQNH